MSSVRLVILMQSDAKCALSATSFRLARARTCFLVSSNKNIFLDATCIMSESNTKDDGMSPDERIAWLRERGVLVETPEERKAKTITNIMEESDETDEAITYVLVPHDASKPLQELSFPVSKFSGDALAERLKPAFGGNSQSIDLNLFQKQAATQLAATDVTVSEAALQQVAKEGNVETFTLVHPSPANHFTGIHIYLDEVGMLKRLSLNKRASDYALRAGFNPAPQFYGDVFMGRVKTIPALTNVSFHLGEDTSFDAPWLQRAIMENLEYQTSLNSVTGRSELQKAVDGEDGIAKAEDDFSWTQTEEELEVVVPLPADIQSKDVQVKYLPQSFQVKCRKEPLLSLLLFERIDPDGCTWTLDRDGAKKRLVITMEKATGASWPRIKN